MKALLLARKSLLEIVREGQLLALTLALPLIFLALTVLTYNRDLLATYRIAVWTPASQGEALVARLEAERYLHGDPIFAILTNPGPGTRDSRTAFALMEAEKLTALVALSYDPASTSLQATIYGDALSSGFYRASTILENTLRDYAREAAGRPLVVEVIEEPLAIAGPENEFDLYAPGMITFGLLMIIPQTAMLVAREVRRKTLERLHLTPMRAMDLFAGISLAQMGVAVVQVILVTLAAVAMGFNNQGSMGLAILVGLGLSFSAIGQGLLVACFVQNDSQAANLGGTFAMIQVFLSGSFYQLPPLTMFTLAGHQIDVFDIFPATHGFRALQQVLTYGDGFREIGFRFAATLGLSLLYFLLGVLIFQRLKMRD